MQEKGKWYIFIDLFKNTYLSILIHRIILPLKVLRLKKGTFFLWFLFTIIAGLLGPIINVANNCGFNEMPMELSILEDSKTGTFYTFSIVLIASAIGSLFLNLLESSDTFRKMKLYFMAICIFPLFFGGIYYSSFSQKQKEEFRAAAVIHKNALKKETTKERNNYNVVVDTKQLVIFILSLIISIYAFCLQYMNVNKSEFKEIEDSYLDKEESGLRRINATLDAETDMEGVKI